MNPSLSVNGRIFGVDMIFIMYGKYGTPTYRRRRHKICLVGVGWHDHESIRSFSLRDRQGMHAGGPAQAGRDTGTRKDTDRFQPIVSLANGSILGYEALSRGPEGLESPDALFSLCASSASCGSLGLFMSQSFEQKNGAALSDSPAPEIASFYLNLTFLNSST